jgi:hypothetical protein
MQRRKIVLLSLLYLGLAAGIPLLLVGFISQSYPIFGDNPQGKAGWELRTQRLLIQPDGQFLLPPSSAFVVDKGQITMLIYPRVDQVSMQSQQFSEGNAFGTWPGRRYSLVNRNRAPVELLLIQALAPGVSYTYNSSLPGMGGFSLELLNRRYISNQPGSDELTRLIAMQRDNLKRGG